jgi:hypothetical protein
MAAPRACRSPRERLFEQQGTLRPIGQIVVMAQPLQTAHPVSDNSPTAGRMPSVLVLAGVTVGGLVTAGAFALWFHYGTQLFFEMIRTGLAACF